MLTAGCAAALFPISLHIASYSGWHGDRAQRGSLRQCNAHLWASSMLSSIGACGGPGGPEFAVGYARRHVCSWLPSRGIGRRDVCVLPGPDVFGWAWGSRGQGHCNARAALFAALCAAAGTNVCGGAVFPPSRSVVVWQVRALRIEGPRVVVPALCGVSFVTRRSEQWRLACAALRCLCWSPWRARARLHPLWSSRW